MSIGTPGGGAFGFYSDSQILDPGIIVHLSAFTDYALLQSSDTWVEAGVSAFPFSDASRRACLIAGYITVDKPLFWNGLLTIANDSMLYLKVRGNLAPMIQLFEHRITPTFSRHMKDILNGFPRSTR
jgi:hypothetical protein